jgi:cytochrome c-type biogenesis protein CcmH
VRRLALVAMVALAVVPAAFASEARPTLADLEDEIMCPVCPGETLEQSSSPAAQQVERLIAVRIQAGDSKQEIKDRLVDQYGPQILAAPPKEGFDLLAWVLPLAGAAGAALVLAFAAWRWSRGRETLPPGAPLDPESERRVDRELARLD